MSKFAAAVIGASSRNIGDDVQTVAAMRLAPGSAKVLNRDRLDKVRGRPGAYRTVLNGWYMYDPTAWPPAPSIDPLIISFHLSNRIAGRNHTGLRPQETLLSGANLDYFKQQAAGRGVGARDQATLDAFRRAGVDAYFSGCLTLTLRPKGLQRTVEVVTVDVDPPAVEQVRQKSGSPVTELTHKINRHWPVPIKLKMVDRLLDRYEQARLVVTSRLHVALPAMALGTPVLLIHKNLDDPRFGGLIDHVHAVTPEDFDAARYDYKLNEPPANSNAWKPMAEELRRKVSLFLDGGEPRSA